MRYVLQMAELDHLGYSGFAFACTDDDIQFSSTSTAAECATPKHLDYLYVCIIVLCIILAELEDLDIVVLHLPT